MILVLGGNGQLGTAFKNLLPDALYPPRDQLDLTQVRDLYEVCLDLAPEAIINCAAYTAVDAAEDNEDLASLVNGAAVGELARCASVLGIPFMTYSTDYVFPGTAARPYSESDPVDPINAYGRSKRRGELLALRFPSSLVVRTSWLISPTRRNFVTTMLRVLAEREAIVVDDQHGCPTVAQDLADASLRALNLGATGVLHLTNTGPTTWYSLARATAQLAGIDPARVKPCTTAEYPRPAPRPAYSVLTSERLEEIGLEPLPHWQDSLRTVIASIKSLAAGS